MPRKDNFPKAHAQSGSTPKARAQRVGSLHLYTHPKLGRKKSVREKESKIILEVSATLVLARSLVSNFIVTALKLEQSIN